VHEYEVVIESDVAIAGVLCLPEDVSSRQPVGAVALIGGSGADTRDGDLVIERASGDAGPSLPGTLRRVAHHLAHAGLASLRWDRRGFGASGGDVAHVGYDTDLIDATACFRWLQSRPEIAPRHIGVAGHSAGALVACRLCRDAPDVAAAGLLGALSSPIDDMLGANVARLRDHWERFTAEQREWLEREMPATLVRTEGMDVVHEAARRGDETVVLEGHGQRIEARTKRLRQDLATSYADEMRPVACPVLVLHGGDDLNVPVEDALRSYQVLRDAGNDDVELVILPGLEHYFCPTPRDPAQRIWERISRESVAPRMAEEALDVISRWAVRTLRP
jgi:alpha-beta hydrolase superfamily lysophospholipase